MKKVTIQAYEDRSRAEGGHAVILLHGLDRPEGPVSFRIRPAEARNADGGGGWISGEHRAVQIARTEQGLEIVAGPGITESEHLLPGTVVEIEVPACGARGEFLWPNVAPLMRPKRKSIVVNKSRSNAARHEQPGPRQSMRDNGAIAPPLVFQREAETRPSPIMALPGKPEAGRASSTKPSQLAQDVSHAATAARAPSLPHEATSTDAAMHTASSAVVEAEPLDPASRAAAGHDTLPIANPPAGSRTDLGPAFANASPERGADTGKRADHRSRDTVEPEHDHQDQHLTPEEIATKHSWAFRKDVSVMLSKKFFALGDSRHDEVQETAVHTAGASGHHSIAAEATAILAHHDGDTGESQLGSNEPLVQPVADPPLAELPHHHGVETFYPHARGSVIAPGSMHAPRAAARESRAPRQALSTGLAAGIATLVIGAIAGVALLSGQQPVGAGEPAKVALAVAPAQAAGSRAPEAAVADATLFDALSVGAVSPKGVEAAGIGAAKALEHANVQLLASGSARDTEEGAFWLKQYIAATLGDERTVRVLTQLGSVYAEPTGRAPDYAKARLLWEIASAAGDPVAMCFLGLLHESGLGIAQSKKSALQWYERSKDKGGCPSIDESLARVRQ